MARTRRKSCPKLLQSIRRNQHIDTTEQAWSSSLSRYRRHDAAILRGQDGAIIHDKCQTASIDSEGGYKLNGHNWLYRKKLATDQRGKMRAAGKNAVRRQLEDC